jgi:outer membrane protein TolC
MRIVRVGLLRVALPALVCALPGAAAGPVTLREAVESAVKNYPAVRAELARVAAAESEVELAGTAYLPRADFAAQVNRATRNNVFGLFFPENVIAPISGPVTGNETWTSTFGSAVGLMFRWEPFDFGLRKANVEVARRRREQAAAGRLATEYEVSLAAADAFFSALAARQAVAAARANVERMEVFARTVSALVAAELRPGADHSRAQAELAQARNEWIAAERQEREQRLILARWMGAAGAEAEIEAGALLGEPPPEENSAADPLRHPLAALQTAGVELVAARRGAIEKEYRPKFEVLSAVYGRGTGARLDGTFKDGANGLAPSTGNWAVGFGVTFPVFDYKQNRVRREIESHHQAEEAARLDEVLDRLKSEVARGRVNVAAARAQAANTPVALEAARSLKVQTQARYNAGLGTVVEVADAQRLLRQAETDDALARLGVWRALFALSAAEGNLEGILARASQ